MKYRTYIVKGYVKVSEKEVLDYVIDLEGYRDENELLEKGYIITDEDWKDCANEKFYYDDGGFDEINFLNVTER